MTATMAAFTGPVPNADQLRRTLERWAFNAAARAANPNEVPAEHVQTLRWAENHSPTLTELSEPAPLRRVLDGLALRLDGQPASSSTVARKRSALYSAFQYAVELGDLQTNPMDRIAWKAPVHTDVVDRRVVVNPDQARALLARARRLPVTRVVLRLYLLRRQAAR